MTNVSAAVVDLVRDAAAAYGRADLVARLEWARRRHSGPPVVVVGGESNQGKSSVVNGICGEAICPSSPLDATAVPTAVHLGGPRTALAHDAGGERPLEVAASALAGVVGEGAGRSHPDLVEVHLGLLDGEDLVVVDLPGAGGWEGGGPFTMLPWVPSAAGVLIAHDAAGPLSADELDLVRSVGRLGTRVAVVLTRIDLHPAWRRVHDEVATQLAEQGSPPVEVLAVSVRLADDPDERARRRSGLTGLLDWVLAVVDAARAEDPVLRAAQGILDEMIVEFRGRLDELRGVTQDRTPAGHPLPWSTVLADGIGDLGTDLDTRWRACVRDLQREADRLVDAGDPAQTWPEIERRLRADTTRAATDLVAELGDGVRRVAVRAAEALGDELDRPGPAAGEWIAERLDGVAVESWTSPTSGPFARGLSALRASYTGVTLAGMVAGLAGLSVAAPVLVTAGAVMMGKSVRDERRREVDQRRQRARLVAQRFLAEASEEVLGVIRRALRDAHRALRDGAIELEEQRRRDLAASLAGIRDVEAELARLEALRDRLAAVDPGSDR